MAADVPDVGFRIILISLSDGRTEGVPVGSYLAIYNPEGDHGNGIAEWTRDPAQAMTFETAEAAAACYRAIPHNRPLSPGRQAEPPTDHVQRGVLVGERVAPPQPEWLP